LVHSIDASVILKFILKYSRPYISIFVIHDCFFVPSFYAMDAHKCIREVNYDLFVSSKNDEASPVLNTYLEQFYAQLEAFGGIGQRQAKYLRGEINKHLQDARESREKEGFSTKELEFDPEQLLVAYFSYKP
jgi:hypothetical protein